MKQRLIFLVTAFFFIACEKDTDAEYQRQITRLQSHRWLLDSIITTNAVTPAGGGDSITVLGPLDSTWLEFNLNTYFEYTYKSGTLSRDAQAYQLTTNESRIYYWDTAGVKNNQVYHNIQFFTEQRLVYVDYLIDNNGYTTVKRYDYHAE